MSKGKPNPETALDARADQHSASADQSAEENPQGSDLEAQFWGQALDDAAAQARTDLFALNDKNLNNSDMLKNSEGPTKPAAALNSNDPFAAFAAGLDAAEDTIVGPVPVGFQDSQADLSARDVDLSDLDPTEPELRLDPLPPTAYPLPKPSLNNDVDPLAVDASPAALDFFGEVDASSPILAGRSPTPEMPQTAAARESFGRFDQGAPLRPGDFQAPQDLDPEEAFFASSALPSQDHANGGFAGVVAKAAAKVREIARGSAELAGAIRPAGVAEASREETRFAVAVLSALEPRLSAEAQTQLWLLISKIDGALDAVIQGRLKALRRRLAESKKAASVSAGINRDSALLSVMVIPQRSQASQLCVAVVFDPQRATRRQATQAMFEVEKDLAREAVRLRWRLLEPQGSAGPARRLAAAGVVLHGLIPVEFFPTAAHQACADQDPNTLRQWGLSKGCVTTETQRQNSAINSLASPKRALATALWRWAVPSRLYWSMDTLRLRALEVEAHALWMDQDALFTAACAPLLARDADLGDAVAKLIPVLYKGAAGRALLRAMNLPEPLFAPTSASLDAIFLPFDLLDARLGIAEDQALAKDISAWLRLRRPRPGFFPRDVQREIHGAKVLKTLRLRYKGTQQIEAWSEAEPAQLLAKGAFVEECLAQLWVQGTINQAQSLRPDPELVELQPQRVVKALLATDLRHRAGLLCLTAQHGAGTSPRLSELEVDTVWVALDRGSALVQKLGRQRGFGWLEVCASHRGADLRVLAMGGSHSWVLAKLVQSVLDALREDFDVLFEHGDGLALLDRKGLKILVGTEMQRRMSRPEALRKVQVIGSSPLVQLVRQTAKQRSASIHIFLGREAGFAVLDAERRAFLQPSTGALVGALAGDLLDFLRASGFEMSATVHGAQQFYAQPGERGIAVRVDYRDKKPVRLWIADKQVALEGDLTDLCAQEILARTPARNKAQFFIQALPGLSPSPVRSLRARSLFEKKLSNKINTLKNTFKKL